MQKIITYFVILIFSVTISAQENSEEKDTATNTAQVKKVIIIFKKVIN